MKERDGRVSGQVKTNNKKANVHGITLTKLHCHKQRCVVRTKGCRLVGWFLGGLTLF